MHDLVSDTAFRCLEVDSQKPLFLAFVDETIPICKAMTSAYAAVESQFAQQIVVARAHVTRCPTSVARYGVQVVPMHYLIAGRSRLWEKFGGLSAAELVEQIGRALQNHSRTLG